MKCTDCPYYWDDAEWDAYNKGEEFDPKDRKPFCHYVWNDNDAPCEEDDRETYDDEPDIPEREEEN